ncbi:MAG: galactose oxidase [Neisseriaceae bacterium]|nr:MAG: galactose oxidase [Neisseriaceae bacterium]
MRGVIKLLPMMLVAAITACGSGGGSSTVVNPVVNGWSWVGGSNESGAYGIYGLQGVPSTTNMPGGRYIAVSWIDNDGNFWLFGGSGNAASGASGNLNDLWKYIPSTNQWVWMTGASSTNAYGNYGTMGVAAAGNSPGARIGAVSWKDKAGNLWLFGGFGYAASGASGALNDLWMYSISSNQWTWVSGANTTSASGVYGTKGTPSNSNVPGARLGSVGWLDKNGNIWLFGGAEDILTARVHNDLWKFNPVSSEWTWVGGESAVNIPGVYGVQSVGVLTNQPGGRLDSISWQESNGRVWVFGGHGIDAVGNLGNLNDLWSYSPDTGVWTWNSGSNVSGAYGIYGTQGVSSPNSIPGAREHRVPISWIGSGGNLLMLGGDGNGASTSGILNDLWSYNPANNQWTWIGGSNESNAFGNYGSLGSVAASNQPGARMDGIGWVDSSGNLWLFGGSGNGASSNGYLNDFWKYN